MQSPLTLQRGRIESNPREYTHMGPRLCGELKTMPADWAKVPRARRTSVENWTLAKREWIFGRTSEDFRIPIEREWIFGRNMSQKPQKPSKYPPSFPDRPKSTLIRRPHISHLSFVTNTRDNRKTRDKYER